ncbi:MAG TPA: DUF2249 domain-containing protein [bacterium]|nr:DUF2249 domain-containing protein [bacterium]
MSSVGEAFRHHHQTLAQELEDRAGPITDGRPGADLAGLVAFLKSELLGHAAAEERNLYPAVEPLLKAHGMATATMRVDHRFLEDHIRKIEDAAGRWQGAGEDHRRILERELARLVLQLQALFRVHLAKEEQVYLPLFEQYVPVDAQRQVMERMHEPISPAEAPAPGGVLDVRQVPPSRRHPLILSTFEALAPGQAFTLVNDHDPKPLYYQFQAELTGQFTWDYVEQGPKVWRVRVGRASVPGRSAPVQGAQ